MAKKCTKCETEQPDENFHRKGRGRRSRCQSCVSDEAKERYRTDPNRKKQIGAAVARRREKLREHLREIKSRTPCADCSRNYPYYVMDFDHVGRKNMNVSEMVRKTGWSTKNMQRELDECEVVCANCHRERTHRRRVAQR